LGKILPLSLFFSSWRFSVAKHTQCMFCSNFSLFTNIALFSGCVWSAKNQETGQDNFCSTLFDSEIGHDTGQNRQLGTGQKQNNFLSMVQL
jgi:hypothetical protein